MTWPEVEFQRLAIPSAEMDTTALSFAVQEMSHTASPCASVERSMESGRGEVVSVQEHHTFCTVKRMRISQTLKLC
jgi:hypothetical protein